MVVVMAPQARRRIHRRHAPRPHVADDHHLYTVNAVDAHDFEARLHLHLTGAREHGRAEASPDTSTRAPVARPEQDEDLATSMQGL